MFKYNKNLKLSRLKELLDYNPDTGLFKWKIQQGSKKPGEIAGSPSGKGHIRIKIDRTFYYAHRLAWLYMFEYLPENIIDHINRVGDDNRIKNLRESTHSCNMRNCKIRKNNTTGVTGVSEKDKSGHYKARIFVNGKNIYLGSFKTILEAAKVRWEAEVKYKYPNCNTTSLALKYIKDNKKD